MHREAHHQLFGLLPESGPPTAKPPSRRASSPTLASTAPVQYGRGRRVRSRTTPPAAFAPKAPGLRAAQHLDLLHIERAAERAEAGEVEVVDEEAHGRVGRLAFVLGIFADARGSENSAGARCRR
jgi:hypothetical protein